MKQIDTTQVVDPNTLQPFTVKSLKFLQDAKAEDDAGIIEALITNNTGSYSATTPYVISGCVVSDSGKDVTDGKIFYGGKFYEVVGVNGTTNVAQLVLTKTQDATADPLTFTDGTNKTVHDIYKYVATDAASGGDFDANDLVSAYGSGKISFLASSANQTTSSTSYVDLTGSTYTTPNDGVSRTYLIQFKTVVEHALNGGAGGEVQILVDGVQKDFSQSYIDILAQTTDLFIDTVTCFTIESVAPNKIIKIQIKATTGGAINTNFKYNKFTIIEI